MERCVRPWTRHGGFRLPLAMLWSSLLALALFVSHSRAIGVFEVPALVGMPGRIYVLTTDVYESTVTVPPDLGHAAAFSIVMVVIVAVLLSFYGRLSKNAERYHSITGKGYRPRPFDLGRGRRIAGALIVINFVVVLLLPLLTPRLDVAPGSCSCARSASPDLPR